MQSLFIYAKKRFIIKCSEAYVNKSTPCKNLEIRLTVKPLSHEPHSEFYRGAAQSAFTSKKQNLGVLVTAVQISKKIETKENLYDKKG